MLGGADPRRLPMDIDPAAQAGHGKWSACQKSESTINHSEKLQDHLHEVGQRIKHHEENVKYLKSLKNKLEELILNMQAALVKYDKASFSKTVNKDSIHVTSEAETIENILKHEESAAAIMCRMKSEAEALSMDHSLTKDVIGIVATLGKVDDDNLSRLLSEYLGLETMLGVVCKTYEGVKALEAYNKDGSINKSFGLHAFADSLEWPLADRFRVICLEKLRSYTGEFIADDPQQRLAILVPRLPNGETPPGFLGFAVNMITIDSTNLYCISKNGCGLRETLFYNLFLDLQVYKSRKDMLKAVSCIRNGAISLDGGIIRSPGVFSLGHPQGDIDVKFPIVSPERLKVPVSYLEMENTIKQTKWKKDQTMEDLKREQALLDHAMFDFETKKLEFIRYLSESSPQGSQYPVGLGSTPR